MGNMLVHNSLWLLCVRCWYVRLLLFEKILWILYEWSFSETVYCPSPAQCWQVFIGVISNLIVFPVNFIIMTLFRKARPRRKRPNRVDEAIKTAHEYRGEASVNDIKPEVWDFNQSFIGVYCYFFHMSFCHFHSGFIIVGIRLLVHIWDTFSDTLLGYFFWHTSGILFLTHRTKRMHWVITCIRFFPTAC